MPLSPLLSRVKLDYYLVALLATVALAAVLPARGALEPIAKTAVYVAVFLLIFLYGARLSTGAVVQGSRIGGCRASCCCRPSRCSPSSGSR